MREGTAAPGAVRADCPWLPRVAVTTAEGERSVVGPRTWSRHPAQRMLALCTMVGYVESAAAGEEIRITDQAASPALDDLGPDSRLFDGETEHAFAVPLHYDDDRPPRRVRPSARFRPDRVLPGPGDLVPSTSRPLNAYLAADNADALGPGA